ncbi:MAG: AAA family ATPase [Treponema sp.]|uniref:AAA family ATPase n=1 Tax=Treponema sp. TaxID=166 RepID=UPI002EB70785|nr:AAA family ATPase [Treponema sp.]
MNLSADIPLNFDGIPTMDNRLSTFYSRETANEQIPLLCSLFEAVFNNDFALIEKFFDKALGFKGTKWNITMGLYWISPYDYISLDSRNRDYLKKSGINIFDEKELNGKNYLIFLEEIKNCIQERKLKEKSIPEISYNAWKNPDNSKGEEIMPDNSLADNLTELLKHTHNLILHGAPGTGKTFLAKQIAERMDCSPNEIGFVQFHPSYDYTDFVEGLRPKNQAGGEIGFERKDGVFKEFCKRALQNLIDSKKSVEVLEKEISINDKVENFLEKAIEEKSEFETATGNKFTIIENAEKNIFVSIPANEKTSELSLPKNDLIQLLNSENKIESGADIKSFFNRKWRTQQDSYIWILYKEINSLKQNVNVQKIEKIQEKKFVFIIDEINRGELSKIFGELFFCIDPGYRGKNGMIKTQYQNLIEKGDEFYDGFFIPENVYIIGTMNDIDRSVDTMDFAFRRRFAFKEIKAAENLEMFDELGEIAGEAKTRLTKLNEEISKITELSSPSSYHIGGAYFLKLNDFEGDSNERFQKLWNYHLEGLLKEYLRGTENAEENFAKLEKAYFLNKNEEESKDFS